jgi:hypothetical protein
MGRKFLAVIPDSIIILVSIAIFLGQSGCAHAPKPVSEEMRAQFGRIGIVPVSSSPKIQFHPEFAKGRLSGAAKGTAVGTGAGALIGLSIIAYAGPCSGEGCVGLAIIAAASAVIGGVLGGVYGGIVGAVDAVPKKEAQRIEAAAKNAFNRMGIQKTMALNVYRTSLEFPDYSSVLLDEEDLIISLPYDFGLLNERGIDTLLELNVKGAGFKEGTGKNPLIAFFMKVNTRLIRTRDGKEIYSGKFQYNLSPKRSPADWFDMDARLLREEIDNCLKELSREIVEELFGKISPNF